jgi:membrane dipeptidase
MQACELTRAPIVASHSGVRALVDSPRNLTDEEMKCIAATGGVVHVVAFGNYLRPLPPGFGAQAAALRAKYGAADEAAVAKLPPDQAQAYQREFLALLGTVPKATLANWIDSVDYAEKLVGIDHVGLSSDFEHGGGVEGFRSEADAPNVTRELLRRGYSREDIAKLWGLNWLRVFRAVESKRDAGRAAAALAPPLPGRPQAASGQPAAATPASASSTLAAPLRTMRAKARAFGSTCSA